MRRRRARARLQCGCTRLTHKTALQPARPTTSLGKQHTAKRSISQATTTGSTEPLSGTARKQRRARTQSERARRGRARGTAAAHLLEADVTGVFTEAAAAHVHVVLADKAAAGAAGLAARARTHTRHKHTHHARGPRARRRVAAPRNTRPARARAHSSAPRAGALPVATGVRVEESRHGGLARTRCGGAGRRGVKHMHPRAREPVCAPRVRSTAKQAKRTRGAPAPTPRPCSGGRRTLICVCGRGVRRRTAGLAPPWDRPRF